MRGDAVRRLIIRLITKGDHDHGCKVPFQLPPGCAFRSFSVAKPVFLLLEGFRLELSEQATFVQSPFRGSLCTLERRPAMLLCSVQWERINYSRSELGSFVWIASSAVPPPSSSLSRCSATRGFTPPIKCQRCSIHHSPLSPSPTLSFPFSLLDRCYSAVPSSLSLSLSPLRYPRSPLDSLTDLRRSEA